MQFYLDIRNVSICQPFLDRTVAMGLCLLSHVEETFSLIHTFIDYYYEHSLWIII